MEPLIRVKNMYKIYNPGENEVRALDDVSLEINQGEFIAIVGHSGSGKSVEVLHFQVHPGLESN